MNLLLKLILLLLRLTLFDLIAKINLPYNGQLWHELRDGNFIITEKNFEKSNISKVNDFISLISQMILPFDKRPTLKELIKMFPQLSSRYQLLLNGKYTKSCEIPKLNEKSIKSLSLRTVPSQEKL